MHVSKFLTPALLFAMLLVQLLQNPGNSLYHTGAVEITRPANAKSRYLQIDSANISDVRQLAKNLDIRHVRNSSYHLKDAASYYHGKRRNLIEALSDKGR